MQRQWIVCAFGDIRGFGLWTSRASTSIEVKENLLAHFYETLQTFVRQRPDVYLKYTGDGFMAVKEFLESDAVGIFEFLKMLRGITRQARLAIMRCPWPAPDGFRIRITCGHVFKIMVVDPNDDERKRLIPEYIEYPTNMAAHLLQVNPHHVALVTEGVIQAIGRRRTFFRARPLGPASKIPQSVNREDVESLWILQF